MSKEDRFTLLNTLSFNDKFFDNENEEYLDSLDVVRILNHYDNTLSEFVKREVEKQDKITDLEAKLAELKQDYDNLFNGYVEAKQQLAEKDQTIERMKYREKISKQQMRSFWKTKYKQAVEEIEMLQEHKKIADNTIEMYSTKCKDSGQDKIEFALEQLEKVKGILNNLQPPPNYPEYSCEFGFDDCRYKVEEIIDEKIEKLQEKK